MPGRCRRRLWYHEAYMRLVGNDSGRAYRDRSHFFAAAATAMRRILVDVARAKETEKRGGGRRREPLDDVAAPVVDEELLALDEAPPETCFGGSPQGPTRRTSLFRGPHW